MALNTSLKLLYVKFQKFFQEQPPTLYKKQSFLFKTHLANMDKSTVAEAFIQIYQRNVSRQTSSSPRCCIVK